MKNILNKDRDKFILIGLVLLSVHIPQKCLIVRPTTDDNKKPFKSFAGKIEWPCVVFKGTEISIIFTTFNTITKLKICQQ